MPTLPTELRNLLERTVIAARDEAERAASAALVRLSVHLPEPFATLSAEERSLRNRLRAEARRLGESAESRRREQSAPHAALVAEVAYAQWHRMLFARFLAENGLLMHPAGVAVTLEECAELAADEGEPDAWMLAARYASAMLPGIFRLDDPTTRVRFDAAGRLALERLLNGLPAAVFTAEDSLGWVYQFWQAKRKKEVNDSGVKVGGADISPVTQLFTEPYMVQFLLHNSLGAWWAARHPSPSIPAAGEGMSASPFPVSEANESGKGAGGLGLDCLRRNDDNTPAAGGFSAWPERAADLRVLDPCCGSGHFLVATFDMLRRFRMMEEGLSEAEAGDAVLRDNLFGLELDPRCTQIAAFALALAAWKAGGYRALPLPNIACAGLPVGAHAYEFTHLADGDPDMETTLRQLHRLFQQAPDLGSLIDPVRVSHEEGKTAQTALQFAPRWEEIAERLEKALAKERADDPASAIFGATARGVARAADLLTRKYHLVVTNVPYLARGKHDAVLRKHIETFHNDAKADLATAFVDRCLRFCAGGGAVALVTPQNWLFLGSYKALRERLLKTATWNCVAKLGPKAFSTPMWDFNVMLFVLTNSVPASEHTLAGVDASAPRVPAEKAEILRSGPVHTVSQAAQLNNPDARIALEGAVAGTLLGRYSTAYQGIKTGDDPRFRRCYWEFAEINSRWLRYQSTVDNTVTFGGLESLVDWRENGRDMARLQGLGAWKKHGVAVSQMRHLPIALYRGDVYDSNVSPIIPHDPAHLPAIWCFCSSPEFHAAVRRIDQALKVTNASLVKVPFDLERWQAVAEEQYPNGLPEPHSDDPTQWLFHGHPARSTSPLQVAVSRLLGYRWPEHGLPETESGKLRQEEDGLQAHAVAEGIVCLPAVAGEPPAAQRLRELLAAAYAHGQEQEHAPEHPNTQTPEDLNSRLERLLAEAGFGGEGLDVWLRDGFFAQHCRLFHNRPFLWHIWDGRKDGFSAIVNYHRLDRSKLDRLIYTYLGDWINTQRHADGAGVAGANARLVAALALQEKLKAIADGEPPYDIYVRWKPLHRQPIGWEPDLNDGVRLNIRPFVTAGVLRAKFTINWNKDRGTNPDGSERLNDLHHTRAEKEAARRTEAGE